MKVVNPHIIDQIIKIQDIDVSMYDQTFLNNAILKRIKENNCSLPEDYCLLLEKNNCERAIFLDSLHVSYSEFFRNPLTFAVLERIILPSLILKKKNSGLKEIRIWSAACAAGQEVYSLAILFEELKNWYKNAFTYRIFATDQNEKKINEAKNGQYNAADVKNITLDRIGKWFIKNEDNYAVKQELKEHIDFSAFNLFNENLSSPPASIFGGFDLVLCANLLFYYKPEYRRMILKKAGRSLIDEGFLVAGETEREILINYDCYEVFPQSGIFRLNDAERRK